MCEQVLSVFVDTYPVYVANILLFRELFTIAKNAKFKTRLQDFLPCTADGDLLFTFSSIF